MGKHSAIRLPSDGPSEIQNFSKGEDRARLSQTALKAFVKLAGRWGMSNPESAALLGVSLSTWERIKRGERTEPLVPGPALTRVSALTGIVQGTTSAVRRDEMAGTGGLSSRTSGPFFENRRPIDAMDRGWYSPDARSAPLYRCCPRGPLSRNSSKVFRSSGMPSPAPSGSSRQHGYGIRC